MRSKAAAAVAAALGIVGLVVSLTALWPRIDAASPSSVDPGLSVAQQPERDTPPAASRREAAEAKAGVVGAKVGTRSSRRTDEVPRVVRVTVDTAGIDSSVRPVGVTPDGLMALPPRPDVLGWYRFGPAPGEDTGSVVLAGHLDSTRYGLGPLVGLREVEVGDPVRVTRAGGERLSYTVVDVRRHDRQALPDELFSRTGAERLRIITCGGEYLPDQGGYQENLVVTAVPD